MNSLTWTKDEELTPVRDPSISPTDILVCNRVIHNEIGPLDSLEREEEAIAIIYALLNLSEVINMSLAKLLTDSPTPYPTDFCTKGVMFNDGRIALLSTYNEAITDHSDLLTQIFSGSIKDPLYGAYRFFNYIEEINPESHRQRWSVGKDKEVKTGIIYGKFEFDPTPFLAKLKEGEVDSSHIIKWENIQRLS